MKGYNQWDREMTEAELDELIAEQLPTMPGAQGDDGTETRYHCEARLDSQSVVRGVMHPRGHRINRKGRQTY